MKKALIIGYTGQDGYYTFDLLQKYNYSVIGISSNSVSQNQYNIQNINICSFEEVNIIVSKFKPDEIYFFAAIHQSSTDCTISDRDLFEKSIDINSKALVNFLDSIRLFSPKTKLFYASSSHIFGNSNISVQNEQTQINPICIYGVSKVVGMKMCEFYQKKYNIFASVGIFYNHESPRRKSNFVSKKIVETAVLIKLKRKKKLKLGSLDSKIDWGYAPDYVKGAYNILQLTAPDTFIISSGKLHTIENFVDYTFSYLGLDWKKYVEVENSILSKKQKNIFCGDSSKLRKKTNWKPSVNFKGMVQLLVDTEIAKYA